MAGAKQSTALNILDMSANMSFMKPKKMIHESQDVQFFLSSKAYTDILTFLLQLNAAMFPHTGGPEQDELGCSVNFSAITDLRSIITALANLIEEAPPDPGPRRFGNVSFRKWFALAESHVDDLLESHLPDKIVDHKSWDDQSQSPALELKAYLLGSFGSPQRLDYGTGHELCFLAFLGSIWKLGGFIAVNSEQVHRAIVVGVIKPYLDLVRRLILTYNLEPAGSHGVWGLDDHAFLPYIFGSAQLAPPVKDAQHLPAEGSAPGAPDPAEVTKLETVDRFRDDNLYFGAIGFIYDVKKGPFWEHSPMLYDISGIKAGWAKINKGMIKMYIAEVLSKFPVVQHFTFGTLFKWERDPHAAIPMASIQGPTSSFVASGDKVPPNLSSASGTAAPWAANAATVTLSESMSSKRMPPGRDKNVVRDVTALSGLSERRPAATSHRTPLPRGVTSATNVQSSFDSSKVPRENPSSVAGPREPTRAPWAKDT